jgi:succinate dehydrogenase / fumarate reductase, membrane anchor subunit
MNLRTPLGTVLGRGSARNGVHHWWLQRLTAVALVPLTVWLLYWLLKLPLADYAAVAAWVASGWNPIWLVLTLMAVTWHSQLGVQVVIEDYIHHQGWKLAALLAANFTHVVVAAAGVYAVLRLALRSV